MKPDPSSKERSKDGAPGRIGGACYGIAQSFLTRRLEIAAQVGSDVPLFLIGGTVLGLDRGQEVYPLPDIEPVWCVVAAAGDGRLHRRRPFATGMRCARRKV